jgi:hypothetical protein
MKLNFDFKLSHNCDATNDCRGRVLSSRLFGRRGLRPYNSTTASSRPFTEGPYNLGS